VVNIPGYSVSGEVGRGGMAVVYRARQVLLDREVALKVLNPTLAQDSVYAQRFLQEARMLAALGHPHIVPVYDVGVTPEGLHYFSMQLVPGGDFGRKLREGIDEAELVRVLLAVAQALGFAHARGYVHRDVTPANILFDERNRPVLTDFGIARALAATSRITASGLSIGTSHYMSPEQARGQEVDRRSDIYSIGVLLFEALSGKPPFEGDDGFAVAYAHVHEPIPRLPEGLERWQSLVDRAMAKLPAERFDDCAAFIEGLRETAPAEFAAVMKREGVQAVAPLPAPIPPPASPRLPRSKAGKGNGNGSGSAAALETGSGGMIRARARSNRLPMWLGAGLVLAGIVLLAVYFLRGEDAPAPPAVAERPAQPAIAPPTVPATSGVDPTGTAAAIDLGAEPAAGLPGLESADGEGAADPAIDLSDLPTVEDPVRKLLGMGRANLAARRLSTPPGNNALDRFKLALVIEPGNKEARAGIAAVAQAYVELAAKQDREAALPQWLEYLDRAESIAREHEAKEALAAATALRSAYADELLARGAEAAANWQRDEAVALHQRALQVLPGSEKAQQGLRAAERVGAPGYVFRDGQNPEMVVVGKVALGRREVTVGEFRAYWSAAGQRKFGGGMPGCRDRESIFRSSRKRTWQEPGFAQDNSHPVVCVSYPMAEDYARWLAGRSNQRYRLPTAAEWRLGGSTSVPSNCSANVQDADFRKAFGGREGVGCADGYATTAPVARFAARKPGLYDVDGNAREWVSDCDGGNCRSRLALGASWNTQPGDAASVAYAAETAHNTIGFRVLRELD
jgi:serine/threonine-protein kinase PpkA